VTLESEEYKYFRLFPLKTNYKSLVRLSFRPRWGFEP